MLLTSIVQTCKYKHLFDFTISPVAFCVLCKRRTELSLPEIRPKGFSKYEFGIRTLPKKIIAQTHMDLSINDETHLMKTAKGHPK